MTVLASVARRAVSAGLPEKVIIGYRTYRLEKWSSAEASGANKFGECCSLSGTIRIRCDVDPTEIVNTLLHEILHASYRSGGIEGRDGEERTVLILANQLTQIWRDNPDLVAWISTQVHR